MQEQNTFKKGGMSVDTAHLFPIIKKWLYSDKEIFVRELISNASDAITKFSRLCSLGEAEDDKEKKIISVIVDKELGTLTFKDNGIGMDSEEIDRYINQIALSGAIDFIQKYENEDTSDSSGIIGHFGLGFYSAFMIADNVEIKSRSFKANSAAVHWKGNDECEFEMSECDKNDRGTEIILHVNDDEKEFLDIDRIRTVAEKFCAFMPYEIYVVDAADASTDSVPSPINDTTPLWMKNAKDCTEEDYNAFYKKVFGDFNDPLFYIHINADYPLNFKGILYFPKLSHEFGTLEGQVKLYYNQVFVADNIKEVIPEYMLMLKGVLDCPELPLNVSRSYLQANGYVSKISSYIVKKVSDKLASIFNTDRERYHNIWEDIKPFVEYGCLKDKKFFDRVRDIVVYKTTDNDFLTLNEYAESDNFDKTIYYSDDVVRQSRYISMFRDQNIKVCVFDKLIDTNFISLMEHEFTSSKEHEGFKFVRVDSGISDSLKKDSCEVVSDETKQLLTSVFREALNADEKFTLSCESLKDSGIPAILNVSEQSRRFADMMKMYDTMGLNGALPVEEKLLLNMSNPLSEKISAMAQQNPEDALLKKLAKQVYMLALVAQRPLEEDELKEFISTSAELFTKL